RTPGERLLPPQRCRAVPWSGYEILAAVLIMVLWPLLILQMLSAPGGAHPADPLLTSWAILIAFPLEVATILALFWRASGTRPYQLGLTGHRARSNAVAGYLGWLVVTPIILGLFYLVLVCYRALEGGPPPSHPLSELVQGHQPILEWALVLFQALVA